MRTIRQAAVFGTLFLALLTGVCEGAGSSKAGEVVKDTGDRRVWLDWGQGGGCVFAVAADGKISRKIGEMIYKDVPAETINSLDPKEYPPPALVSYGWDKEGKFGVMIKDIVLPQMGTDVQWIPEKRQYVRQESESPRRDAEYVLITFTQDGTVVRKQPVPPGWYMRRCDLSENGRYLAFGLTVNTLSPHAPPDCHALNPGFQVGLMDCRTGAISWTTTIKGVRVLLRHIVPSNDGKYIACGSIDNGVTVFDVKAKKHLWTIFPEDALNVNHVAFSPKGDVVYAGGSAGCLFVLETKTGKLLASRWAAPSAEKGKRWMGRNRFSCIAVSPDGKYVAGSADKTYVWDTTTLKVVRVTRYGAMGMQFSPDSKKLALVSAGQYVILDIAK